MSKRRFVVVGAGMCGGNVAVTLRDEGFDGEIVVLGDEPAIPFGRPPLSKTYLRGEEDLSGWFVKPADWYAQHDVALRTEESVERIDTADSSVVLASGERIRCDSVCLASGARARPAPGEGSDLDGIFVLRTKADADAIRAQARPGSRCVVAGMSFIGAEVAASLRQMGVDVTAVFPGPGPLASVLGDDVAKSMADIHRDHGVELVPNDKVVAFRGTAHVDSVVTDRGRTLECSFCVVGVGVEPNAGIAEASGLAVDDGVVVDASCKTSADSVFAAGDVASHEHPLFGRIRVEHYNNAENQGRHVARSMLGNTAPYDYVHTFWSDQYDDKIEYVGHAKHWDQFVVRGSLDERKFVGFYLTDGRLAAAVGLNRGGDPELDPDGEMAACAALIRSASAVDPDVLADDEADLSELPAARR